MDMLTIVVTIIVRNSTSIRRGALRSYGTTLEQVSLVLARGSSLRFYVLEDKTG